MNAHSAGSRHTPPYERGSHDAPARAAMKAAWAEREARIRLLEADLDGLRLAVNAYLLAQNNRGLKKGKDKRRHLCETVYDLNVRAEGP